MTNILFTELNDPIDLIKIKCYYLLNKIQLYLNDNKNNLQIIKNQLNKYSYNNYLF